MVGVRTCGAASLVLRVPSFLGLKGRRRMREVYRLETQSEQRGHGHATALLENVGREADANGMLLVLIAETAELEQFYKRRGFETLQENPTIMNRKPNG